MEVHSYKINGNSTWSPKNPQEIWIHLEAEVAVKGRELMEATQCPRHLLVVKEMTWTHTLMVLRKRSVSSKGCLVRQLSGSIHLMKDFGSI